jgi:hypothetical protein
MWVDDVNRQFFAGVVAVASLALSACGGDSSGGASGCESANVTVNFAGDTSLEPGPRDELLALIEENRDACPVVYVTVYEDSSGLPTAEMRDNHISNLLSIRADVAADDKVRAIEPVPSNDLAGRALIEMRAE